MCANSHGCPGVLTVLRPVRCLQMKDPIYEPAIKKSLNASKFNCQFHLTECSHTLFFLLYSANLFLHGENFKDWFRVEINKGNENCAFLFTLYSRKKEKFSAERQ